MKHYSYISSYRPTGHQTFTSSLTGKSPHGTGSIRTLGSFGTPCPSQAGCLRTLQCRGKGVCSKGGRAVWAAASHTPAPDRQGGPCMLPTPTFGAVSTQNRSGAAAWMQQPRPWGKAHAANSALRLHGYSSDDQKSTAANAHLFSFAATLAPLLSRHAQEQGVK